MTDNQHDGRSHNGEVWVRAFERNGKVVAAHWRKKGAPRQARISEIGAFNASGAIDDSRMNVLRKSPRTSDGREIKPSLRLGTSSTEGKYISLFDDHDRTPSDLEDNGRELAHKMLPGDYRGYFYDENKDRDVPLVLHVGQDGEVTSDLYENVPKDEAWKMPASDGKIVAAEYSEKVGKLYNRLVESMDMVPSDGSKSVYNAVSADVDDILHRGGFNDSVSASQSVIDLKHLRDLYEEAGDDASFDGDSDEAASFEEAADMIDEILPPYMQR
jgi:hypothetical protein